MDGEATYEWKVAIGYTKYDLVFKTSLQRRLVYLV
jgi:hypothetical protein